MARKAPSITSEMGTQSDLSVIQKIIFLQWLWFFKGTTIALFNDELAALRDALTDKDQEIDRLRAENIERMQMPPPIHASTPSNLHTISINLNKSKRKSKEMSKSRLFWFLPTCFSALYYFLIFSKSHLIKNFLSEWWSPDASYLIRRWGYSFFIQPSCGRFESSSRISQSSPPPFQDHKSEITIWPRIGK